MSPAGLFLGVAYAAASGAAAALYLARPVAALVLGLRAAWARFTDLSNLDLGGPICPR